jgi:hypothetical protein
VVEYLSLHWASRTCRAADVGAKVCNLIKIMAAVALVVMSVAGIGGVAVAAPAGSITGCVRAVNGTPINEAHVVAYDNATWEQEGEGYTGADGSYCITIGTGTGTYRVKAQAMGYAAEYYDDVSDPAAATTVAVTAGGETKDINFTLTQIGFISCTVFGAGGAIPIPTARVVAYDSATGNWVDESDSGASPGYYYMNLPPGRYRLKSEAAGYLTEWYANATSFGAATPVSVIGLDGRPYINFTLETVLGVTTDPATCFTTTSARLNGSLSSMGASKDVIVSFEWGITEGGPYPKSAADQVRTTIGAISFDLSGLTPGTTYYFRAKADGDGGPVYGAEKSFTTIDPTAPVISVVTSSGITKAAATITWDTNEAASSQVEYGPTEEYGSTTTLDETKLTSHSVDLSELKAGKTYHYRVLSKDAADNQAASGDETFTTAGPFGRLPRWAAAIVGLAVLGLVGAAYVMIHRMSTSNESDE